MSKVVELFGHSVNAQGMKWRQIVSEQQCAFLKKKCYKTRKSDAKTAIGTCTVQFGEDGFGQGDAPVIICPTRMVERRQIFTDCLHLLTNHEPGNELHIVSEVSIPGGMVDFFLVSARDGKVRDFVGIEIQTLDTSGSVWPERQRLLRELGVPRSDDGEGENSESKFGMNWKMTAKTILVQMHHKIHTFEHVNRKLVLVVQDRLLGYMRREFNFGHVKNVAALGDPMHFHSYRMEGQPDGSFKIGLQERLSTDGEGISVCLGLQAEARVELAEILAALEAKISSATRFVIV